MPPFSRRSSNQDAPKILQDGPGVLQSDDGKANGFPSPLSPHLADYDAGVWWGIASWARGSTRPGRGHRHRLGATGHSLSRVGRSWGVPGIAHCWVGLGYLTLGYTRATYSRDIHPAIAFLCCLVEIDGGTCCGIANGHALSAPGDADIDGAPNHAVAYGRWFPRACGPDRNPGIGHRCAYG